MKILIGADIVPTNSNIELFQKGDLDTLIGVKLAERLKQADFRIFNLETPIAETSNPIPKRGPHLLAHRDSINAIDKMGIDLLTICNNHIMDHGESGLFDTIKEINNTGRINYVGAGKDINDARMPFIIKGNEYKIGIYACCEHEFSIAKCNKPGANPYDPLTTFDDIVDLRKNNDFVFVLYHGGREEYRYPSPELQKRCRKMIEKGADLVICQHTHCIGCEENYLNGKIVYGQGNFIFDLKENEYWNSGLVIECNIDNSRHIEYSYLPIIKNKHVIRLAEESDSQSILRGFFERSSKIQDIDYVEQRYSEYAEKKANDYLSAGFGVFRTSFFGKVLNKFFGRILWKRFFRTKDYLSILNNLECEAHSELFRHAIQDIINRNCSSNN